MQSETLRRYRRIQGLYEASASLPGRDHAMSNEEFHWLSTAVLRETLDCPASAEIRTLCHRLVHELEAVESGWTSIVGPLPQSILPRPAAAPPKRLSEALIAAVIQRVVSEGLARIAPAAGPGQTYTIIGCDVAEGPDTYGAIIVRLAPCSLCAAAGGAGCESPTCRRPA